MFDIKIIKSFYLFNFSRENFFFRNIKNISQFFYELSLVMRLIINKECYQQNFLFFNIITVLI